MAESMKKETKGRINITKSSQFDKYESLHKLKSSIGSFKFLKVKKKTVDNGLKADKYAYVLRYQASIKELIAQQTTQLVNTCNYKIHQNLAPTQAITCFKGDKDAIASKFIINLLSQEKPNAPEKAR